MPINRPVSLIALWILLLIGFAYAVLVSYRNFTGDLCPAVGPVPICYIVLLAYALMILSLVVNHNGCKHYFFTAGWGIAFVLAVVGSAAEFFTSGGGVCPSSAGGGLRGASQGGVPMCYVSLALLVVILVLFLHGPYRAACDAHNANH